MGHEWERQAVLVEGQMFFLWVLRFLSTFDEQLAWCKWNILERAVKPKSKKKKKKKVVAPVIIWLMALTPNHRFHWDHTWCKQNFSGCGWWGGLPHYCGLHFPDWLELSEIVLKAIKFKPIKLVRGNHLNHLIKELMGLPVWLTLSLM